MYREGHIVGHGFDQQIPFGGNYAISHVSGDRIGGIAVNHMGHLAKAAGAEAVGQHVDILEIADGGQSEIGFSGDYPDHGPREGIDSDLDGHIGVEIVDGVHQIDERARLVGIDQPR